MSGVGFFQPVGGEKTIVAGAVFRHLQIVFFYSRFQQAAFYRPGNIKAVFAVCPRSKEALIFLSAEIHRKIVYQLAAHFIAGAADAGPERDVLSSAMSWMYFLIVILIIAIVAGLLSAFIFYQKKD